MLSRWATSSEARLVVTGEYKYEDSSDERKASLVNATSKGYSDKNFYNAKPPVNIVYRTKAIFALIGNCAM